MHRRPPTNRDAERLEYIHGTLLFCFHELQEIDYELADHLSPLLLAILLRLKREKNEAPA